MSQAGLSQQLWYGLSLVNILERDPLERRRTIDITGILPVLKQRAHRPKDEVPSRVCSIGRSLDRLRARSSVLLEDLLIGCGLGRGRPKDNQKAGPASHESEEQSPMVAGPGIPSALRIGLVEWRSTLGGRTNCLVPITLVDATTAALRPLKCLNNV